MVSLIIGMIGAAILFYYANLYKGKGRRIKLQTNRGEGGLENFSKGVLYAVLAIVFAVGGIASGMWGLLAWAEQSEQSEQLNYSNCDFEVALKALLNVSSKQFESPHESFNVSDVTEINKISDSSKNCSATISFDGAHVRVYYTTLLEKDSVHVTMTDYKTIE